jgi:hypothetical protein
MRTALSVLIALSAIAGAAATANAEEPREAAGTEQLCSYCQDYTDAATATEAARTAYQVGVGYPDEKKVAEIGSPERQRRR